VVGVTWFLERQPAVLVNLAVFKVVSGSVTLPLCPLWIERVAVVVSEKLHFRCNVREAGGIARIEG